MQVVSSYRVAVGVGFDLEVVGNIISNSNFKVFEIRIFDSDSKVIEIWISYFDYDDFWKKIGL